MALSDLSGSGESWCPASAKRTERADRRSGCSFSGKGEVIPRNQELAICVEHIRQPDNSGLVRLL
jgi:hypothetical protein